MNALQRDLKRLVPMVEAAGAAPTASGSTCSHR